MFLFICCNGWWWVVVGEREVFTMGWSWFRSCDGRSCRSERTLTLNSEEVVELETSLLVSWREHLTINCREVHRCAAVQIKSNEIKNISLGIIAHIVTAKIERKFWFFPEHLKLGNKDYKEHGLSSQRKSCQINWSNCITNKKTI